MVKDCNFNFLNLSLFFHIQHFPRSLYPVVCEIYTISPSLCILCPTYHIPLVWCWLMLNHVLVIHTSNSISATTDFPCCLSLLFFHLLPSSFLSDQEIAERTDTLLIGNWNHQFHIMLMKLKWISKNQSDWIIQLFIYFSNLFVLEVMAPISSVYCDFTTYVVGVWVLWMLLLVGNKVTFWWAYKFTKKTSLCENVTRGR